jgi:hypothetical protein
VLEGSVNSKARHGLGMAQTGPRRAAVLWPMASSGQRAAGATGGRATRGLPRESTDIVHRSQRAWRTDPWTRAGLGVRVR